MNMAIATRDACVFLLLLRGARTPCAVARKKPPVTICAVSPIWNATASAGMTTLRGVTPSHATCSPALLLVQWSGDAQAFVPLSSAPRSRVGVGEDGDGDDEDMDGVSVALNSCAGKRPVMVPWSLWKPHHNGELLSFPVTAAAAAPELSTFGPSGIFFCLLFLLCVILRVGVATDRKVVQETSLRRARLCDHRREQRDG